MSQVSDLVFDLVKDLVWDNLVDAALKAFFAAYPALAWGPARAFLSWAINRAAEFIWVQGGKVIDWSRIVITNPKLEKEFTNESVKLKIIARSDGIDSDKFRSAREESKRRLSDLVRFDVAR